MISKETYDKIQEYKNIGLSVLKATEKLGISYNTTYKWWNKTEEEFYSFQKEHEFVLDNYRQFIIEQLKLCPQINNTLVRRRLKEAFPDFEIPNATFFRYMKKLREQKVALAQAIIQVLWMKDFLSTEEREKMNEYCEKSVYKPVHSRIGKDCR